MAMLSNIPPELNRPTSFRPYPNETSFRLGNWYWNGGVQKSQEDFQQLLKIVGDESFVSGDVRAANWDKINQQLACNKTDGVEWLDDEDAGWRTDSVKIHIPFHRFTDKPGCQDYVATDFHHRPLVSVIREKLQNPCDSHLFHYEPYELFWKPTDEHEEVRVHGELYSSPAFIAAHNEVQDLPGENCTLPRVVVALMFWSDSTQLTNFGDAQLWPLYMFFGNESKYRRCQPSCNLCQHIAYFEKVSNPAISWIPF
jgi:hypothetical protein